MSTSNAFVAKAFSVGAVLRTSWAVLRRLWLPFLGIQILSNVATTLILQSFIADRLQYQMAMINWRAMALLAIIAAFFTLLSAMFCTAVISICIGHHLDGQPLRIVAAIAGAAKSLHRLIAILLIILAALTSVVALMVPLVLRSGTSQIEMVALLLSLATAPVMALVCIFFVAVPACVVERAGPLRSFKLSRRLTAGHRWAILVLIVIVHIIPVLINLALALGLDTISELGVTILQTEITAVLDTITAVIVAVAYFQLRAAKDGNDLGPIAQVF